MLVKVLESATHRRRAREDLRWQGLLPVHADTTRSNSNLADTFQVINIRIDQATGTIDTTGIRSLCGDILPALGWIQRMDDTLRDGFRIPSSNAQEGGILVKDGAIDSSWKHASSSSTANPSYGHAFAGAFSSSYSLTTLKRIDDPSVDLGRRIRPLSLDNSWHTLRPRLEADPCAVVRWSDLQGRSGRSNGKALLENRIPSRGSATFLDVRFSDRTSWTGSILLPR